MLRMRNAAILAETEAEMLNRMSLGFFPMASQSSNNH
jgi:hypothetical protein